MVAFHRLVNLLSDCKHSYRWPTMSTLLSRISNIT
jgi:hypothetical protein